MPMGGGYMMQPPGGGVQGSVLNPVNAGVPRAGMAGQVGFYANQHHNLFYHVVFLTLPEPLPCIVISQTPLLCCAPLATCLSFYKGMMLHLENSLALIVLRVCAYLVAFAGPCHGCHSPGGAAAGRGHAPECFGWGRAP